MMSKSVGLKCVLRGGCSALILIMASSQAMAQDASEFETTDLQDLQKQINDLKAKVDVLQQEKEAANNIVMNAEQLAAIEPAAGGQDNTKINWDLSPVFTSSDDRFSFQINGRIGYDYANINFKDGSGAVIPGTKVNGIDNRYLETGFRGKMFGDINYRVAVKFVDNEVELKLAYMDYEIGNTNLIIGQVRTYTSLDKLTPPPNHSFSERFAFINALSIKPRIGVAVAQHGDNWSVSGGYFFESTSSTDGSLDDNNMASGRVTFSPTFENGLGIHLGSSFFYRNENGNGYDKGYATRPLSKQGAIKPLYSGEFNIGSEKFIGGEFVATYKSFGFQAEYAQVTNDLNEIETQTATNPKYEGGYVEFGFFPTGAERTIRGTDGRYSNVKIDNPVGEGGFGEVRLAVRYDMADFTHEIFGTKQKSLIFSADWYLNDYLKIQGNFAKSTIKDYQDIKTNEVDTFNLRFLMSF
ncbi:MAG: porin [Emcibacteraceae bacterium]|nr:porin [Emcibacteraceae bacterium]